MVVLLCFLCFYLLYGRLRLRRRVFAKPEVVTSNNMADVKMAAMLVPRGYQNPSGLVEPGQPMTSTPVKPGLIGPGSFSFPTAIPNAQPHVLPLPHGPLPSQQNPEGLGWATLPTIPEEENPPAKRVAPPTEYVYYLGYGKYTKQNGPVRLF